MKRIYTMSVGTFLLVVMIAVIFLAASAAPAQACSCGGSSDLGQGIERSEAAFVGKLVDKRGAGGGESIYVFEVEEWVKGDLGEVIEVRSASHGAACGFELSGEARIGAFVRLESGELRGGLCSQVDADALLAAAHGPRMSATGVGRLLLANASASDGLTVLDETGATVGELTGIGSSEESAGTAMLETCPGGEVAVQLTNTAINVWDLTDLELLTTHSASHPEGGRWVRAVSCRTPDASSIWAVADSEQGAGLYEIVPDWERLIDGLPGDHWQVGTSFVIAQNEAEDDPILIDVATGKEILLHETPPDALQAVNVAPHPTDDLVAMLETRFSEGGPVDSTLLILDSSGAQVMSFEIPWESYRPVWLDDDRVIVQAYDFDDWERSFGYVFDTSTQEMEVLEGWNANHPVATGTTLYGISGGDILTADLETGEHDRLATMPAQSVGPLVILEDDPTQTSVTTTQPDPAADGSTPPLVAPDLGAGEQPSIALRWVAGLVVVCGLAGLVWLARRSSGHGS